VASYPEACTNLVAELLGLVMLMVCTSSGEGTVQLGRSGESGTNTCDASSYPTQPYNTLDGLGTAWWRRFNHNELLNAQNYCHVRQ
jgi:hypothetical protein